MTNHRITTAAAILSLAAAAAPTAIARPLDDPAIAANRAPTTVYSRPDKAVVPVNSPSRFDDTTATNPALPPILPSVKAPQLAAIEQAARQAAAYPPTNGAPYSNVELNAYTHALKRQSSSGVVVAATPHNGFDWGDAGVGAAGGLALAMPGLGAALLISQRRPPRSRHSSVLPS